MSVLITCMWHHLTISIWKWSSTSRIWNKRRIHNRIGKAALPCPYMNRETCCLQLGQLIGANWNRSFGQWLHTGKETTTPHNRTKTQYQWTTDWTKSILIFSTSKLTKTISPTVWLKLNLDPKKKEGSVTRCTLIDIEGLFSTLHAVNEGYCMLGIKDTVC